MRDAERSATCQIWYDSIKIFLSSCGARCVVLYTQNFEKSLERSEFNFSPPRGKNFAKNGFVKVYLGVYPSIQTDKLINVHKQKYKTSTRVILYSTQINIYIIRNTLRCAAYLVSASDLTSIGNTVVYKCNH